MKSIILFPFVFLFAVVQLYAQSSLGIDIQTYSPTGEMNKNVSGTPAGLSFRYLRSTSDTWSFGGELGIAMYSSETYMMETSSGEIEMYEEDCFWTIHGMAQYTLFQSETVRYYAEGRVGLTNFFSDKMAEDEEYDEYDHFESHGTAFNMGIGNGLTINTGKLFTGSKGGFNIDLGVNLHSGTRTNYRNINNDDSVVSNLDEGDYRSLTHYVAYRFGVLIDL